MKKLLLTLIIALSTPSLHGMQMPPKLPQITTLAQKYNCFAYGTALVPDIAQQIFSLHFDMITLDLETDLKQNCKDPDSLVGYIKSLIRSCGHLLASELCKQSFARAQISLCDIKDKYDQTALHCAAYHNHIDVAKILLDTAGDKAYTFITMRRYDDYTALHSAAHQDHIEIAKLLLDAAGNKAYALLTMQEKDGYTALHYAVWSKPTNMATLLLDAAGDKAYTLLTIQRDDGYTALHSAAWLKCPDKVKFLLNAAGDKAQELIDIKSDVGQTAFDIANPEIKEFMQQYINKQNQKNCI